MNWNWHYLLRTGRALPRDIQGGAVVLFSLVLPLLLGCTGAAVSYAQLTARRTELQSAADAAVSAATRELSLSNAEDERLLSVAKAAAAAMLGRNSEAEADVTMQPEIVREAGQRAGIHIRLEDSVATPFGELLGQGKWPVAAEATAVLSGVGKVCLIGIDDRLKGTLSLKKKAQISAEGCGIYSNSRAPDGLAAEDESTVVAALTCSAGGFKEGRKGVSIQPRPVTDCPTIGDPLSERPAPRYQGGCSIVKEVVRASKPVAKPVVVTDLGAGVELNPGIYCHGLKIHGGATVRLKPGIYVMRGPFVVDESTLIGQNVGFYFESDRASLLFDYDSSISLSAPATGDMAGLLMFEERRVVNPDSAPLGKLGSLLPPLPIGSPKMREYRIISDDAQTLLGTIYLPSGRLIIDSKRPVAAKSAYTVVIARRIELFEGPNLVLNTNYSGTDIPVPKGVGPVGRTVRLTQ